MASHSLPLLLTVEEAGALLRIGRTKAYAMAREWRETDGRSGLPVIDLGHVLRVPRRALEDLIGSDLAGVDGHGRAEEAGVASAPPEPTRRQRADSSEPTPPKPSGATERPRRRKDPTDDQLDFFDHQQAPS